ncbi:alpha/beta fold hydrolase [Bosea massiliensis]|jgi:2-hydroxy-6-oxonona-2,4-dienedioate hydrolase|uniref:Alpha/beta fold hydrolase n=1 Tax=Bosea massiliensis TaxID=151419 RepID=A0ABW0NU20_9HYPH
MNAHPKALAVSPEYVGSLTVRRYGDGPLLVLVHGGVGSASHWIANLEALSRRFEVAAVELPGYGDAPAPRERDALGYVEEVIASFAQIAPATRQFGLVGFSFGGVISAAVARRLGTRVRALSLLGPGGFGIPAGRDVTLLPVPPITEDPTGHAGAVAQNLGTFMLASAPAPDDPVVRLQSENIARTRFDSRKLSFQDRLIDDLRASSTPLQLIWGESDRLPVPSIAARIDLVRRARPDAEFHVVPDAGHWVQFEAPDAVDALLINFHERVAI